MMIIFVPHVSEIYMPFFIPMPNVSVKDVMVTDISFTEK
jgi:hypothetical protein